MILLDTHIWIWWVNKSAELSVAKEAALSSCRSEGYGVSAITCWEVAKLVEKGRLTFQ